MHLIEALIICLLLTMGYAWFIYAVVADIQNDNWLNRWFPGRSVWLAAVPVVAIWAYAVWEIMSAP